MKMEQGYIPLADSFKANMLEMMSDEAHELFEALDQSPTTSIRLNPFKAQSVDTSKYNSIPWHSEAYYLDSRPSFITDPLWHAGAYYVQEAASMFIRNIVDQNFENRQEPLVILDLCAAPGGKSGLLSSINENSLIVCNEIVRSRYNILKENMLKWGNINVVLSNLDAQSFSSLKGLFDLVLVDAPCSGEGMFRKDLNARREWSESLVAKCVKRQKQILDSATELLKQGGLLIYSTCTFNIQENEDMVDWVCKEKGFESLEIQRNTEWRIKESFKEGVHAYRFMPHRTKSEGLFVSALRKQSEAAPVKLKSKKKSKGSPMIKFFDLEKLGLDRIQPEKPLSVFSRDEKLYYAIQKEHKNLLSFILENLKGSEALMCLGEMKHKSFVPAHALALANHIHLKYESVELSLKQALKYLKNEVPDIEVSSQGWVLARYKGLRLGWMKSVPGRINNYYPKTMRIQKNIDFDNLD